MDPARRLAAYADLLLLDEDERAEILAGEIATAPAQRPGIRGRRERSGG